MRSDGVGSFDPEPCPEVVRAGEESAGDWRVDQVSDASVVAQRQELFASRTARVPAAQGGRRLVGEHDKVFRVVEAGLSQELLKKVTRSTRGKRIFRQIATLACLPVAPAPV